MESLGEFFLEASCQRCKIHFYRNDLKDVHRASSKEVAAILKAIHAQEDRTAALAKAEDVEGKLGSWRLTNAAKTLRLGVEET